VFHHQHPQKNLPEENRQYFEQGKVLTVTSYQVPAVPVNPHE
jgi:hypothetical protein